MEDTYFKISEYKMFQQVNALMNSNESLMDVYRKGFTKMCARPIESLLACGYTSDEVAIMKDYLDGKEPFEEAATKASAQLIIKKLSCNTHTGRLYTCSYFWEWDKPPATGSAMATHYLAMTGITSGSVNLDSHVVPNTSISSVYYYDYYGKYYKTASPDKDFLKQHGCASEFRLEMLNDTKDEYIWAKHGDVIASIEPSPSDETKVFLAARAEAGFYYTISGSSFQYSVSTKLGISVTITVSNGASLTRSNLQNIIFYNDGTEEPQTIV